MTAKEPKGEAFCGVCEYGKTFPKCRYEIAVESSWVLRWLRRIRPQSCCVKNKRNNCPDFRLNVTFKEWLRYKGIV